MYKILFIFERESASGGRAGRGGQRSLSQLRPDSNEPDVGLELTNHGIMT